MKKFEILGSIIEFDESTLQYVKLRNETEKFIANKREEYFNRYKSYKNIEVALSQYGKDMSEIILKAARYFQSKMANDGDYSMTAETFYKKYCGKYNCCYDYFDKISMKYEEYALEDRADTDSSRPVSYRRSKFRNLRRTNRDKWIANGCILNGMQSTENDKEIFINAFAIALQYSQSMIQGIDKDIDRMFGKVLYNSTYKKIHEDKETFNILSEGIENTIRGVLRGYCDYLSETNTNKIKIDCDTEKSMAIIYNIKNINTYEKRGELAVQAIEADPFNYEAYKYLLTNFKDSNGDIEEMANLFIPEKKLSNIKVEAMKKKFKALDVSTEEKAIASREQFIVYVKENSIKESIYNEFINAYDIILKEYDIQYRTVEGIQYECREDAKVAREEKEKFYFLYNSIDVNDENELLNLKSKVSKEFNMKSKKKYIKLIDEMINFYDENYRTVNGIIFETRDIADKAKNELNYIRGLINDVNYENYEELKILSNKIDNECSTEIKNKWIEKINHSANEIYKCNVYLSKNNNFPTRLELNRKILEGRVIIAELNSLNIKITKINKFLDDLNNIALNVFGEKCNNIDEANKRFYKLIKHSIIYSEYLDEQQKTNKSFFKKLGSNIKGVWIKKYEGEYNLVTSNGVNSLPNDKVEDLDTISKEIQDSEKKISSIEKINKEKYISLENNDRKSFEKNKYYEDIILTEERIKVIMSKPLNKNFL